MAEKNNRPSACRSIAAGLALTTAIIFGVGGCGGDNQEPANPDGRKGESASFTFFDVGRDSLYSEKMRRSLAKKLGNDAISFRNTVSLETNYPGFLKAHFPDLYGLNRELNSEIDERVDHNTVRLTYRYARKQEVPFDYVGILFSNYSKKPLLIQIEFDQDRLGTLNQLKSKYGSPGEIGWRRGGGKTFFWEKQQDYMLFSLVPDQFGQPEYRIDIFFTSNLRQLTLAERDELRKRNEQKESVKSAF